MAELSLDQQVVAAIVGANDKQPEIEYDNDEALPSDESPDDVPVVNDDRKLLIQGVSGKVKWFNVKQGYGFITRDDTEEDVFVHQTAISKNNPNKYLRSLGDGEDVLFDVVEGSKGVEACSVTGPGGEPVQGSKFAPDRRRVRYPRGTGPVRRGRGGYSRPDDSGSPGSGGSEVDSQEGRPRHAPVPFRGVRPAFYPPPPMRGTARFRGGPPPPPPPRMMYGPPRGGWFPPRGGRGGFPFPPPAFRGGFPPVRGMARGRAGYQSGRRPRQARPSESGEQLVERLSQVQISA